MNLTFFNIIISRSNYSCNFDIAMGNLWHQTKSCLKKSNFSEFHILSFALKTITSILFVLITLNSSAQTEGSLYDIPYKIENGDTVYTVMIDEVHIISRHTVKNPWDEKRYWRLVYNLKKVYPYAKLAKNKLIELNSHFVEMKTEKEKKEYTKQVEKELKAQFEEELKNLTVTQGRLLIKLIDRETGKTSYELVKELRGNISAIFWQTLAKLFGSSLKAEYDANGSDKQIEDILIAIDQGFL
jgi:hypothetical protein